MPPHINVTVLDTPPDIIPVEISDLASTGGSGEPISVYERRHIFETLYDYNGKALLGSLEEDPVWTITRLTMGDTTVSAIATGVSWTGRASHTYT